MMRRILLNWLIEVNINFQFSDSTYFLTVNLIDRYLSRKKCTRRYLQLIGLTAMFISNKFNEDLKFVVFIPIISTLLNRVLVLVID